MRVKEWENAGRRKGYDGKERARRERERGDGRGIGRTEQEEEKRREETSSKWKGGERKRL